MYSIQELGLKYKSLVGKANENKNASNEANVSEFLILSGMSGVGKTTIGQYLERHYGYKKLRNIYTRTMRDAETSKDGIFITHEEFESMKSHGKLASYGQTNGVWHGISYDEINKCESEGRVWADKSVKSMLRLGEPFRNGKTLVYIYVNDIDTIYQRLSKRNSELRIKLSEQEISERIAEEIDEFEKSFTLPYRYIENDELNKCIAQIIALR